ncbi:Protein SprT, partial [Operophtera brumata]
SKPSDTSQASNFLCKPSKLSVSVLLATASVFGEVHSAASSFKVLMFLPFRYPTTEVYHKAQVLSVRKLFIYQCLRRYQVIQFQLFQTRIRGLTAVLFRKLGRSYIKDIIFAQLHLFITNSIQSIIILKG